MDKHKTIAKYKQSACYDLMVKVYSRGGDDSLMTWRSSDEVTMKSRLGHDADRWQIRGKPRGNNRDNRRNTAKNQTQI